MKLKFLKQYLNITVNTYLWLVGWMVGSFVYLPWFCSLAAGLVIPLKWTERGLPLSFTYNNDDNACALHNMNHAVTLRCVINVTPTPKLSFQLVRHGLRTAHTMQPITDDLCLPHYHNDHVISDRRGRGSARYGVRRKLRVHHWQYLFVQHDREISFSAGDSGTRS